MRRRSWLSPLVVWSRVWVCDPRLSRLFVWLCLSAAGVLLGAGPGPGSEIFTVERFTEKKKPVE